MKPEAADYLNKARKTLKEARAIADIALSEAAGRAAYLVAFHAAQAYIMECTGKIAKTHRGVQSEFARLAKDEPRIDRSFTTFLARAYILKSVADYGVDHDDGVTLAEAEEAIESASRFLDGIADLISAPKPASPA